MEEIKTAEGGTIIKMPIDAEMKQAYIDYSMSVITSRALPDVRDGLKPVHGASLRLAIEFFATQKTRRRYLKHRANSFRPSSLRSRSFQKIAMRFFGTTGLHGGLGCVGIVSD